MNRLHQLKETLPLNVEDNSDYEKLQFLILDYNSNDGLGEWVKANLSSYISTGRVVYYRTTEPQSFNHSHSKNIAFKLADGDIVCNINADHYTGFGFAEYVNASFLADCSSLLTTIDYHATEKGYSPPSDVFGKVCVKKNDFYTVRGFDERMNRYGFEDWDFINRLEMTGLKRAFIKHPSYLRFVPHQDDERYSLQHSLNSLAAIYVNYLSPSNAQILILNKSSIYEFGELIDHSTANSERPSLAYIRKKHRFQNSLKKGHWDTGTWLMEKGNPSLTLYPSNDKAIYLDKETCTQTLKRRDTGECFYQVTDSESVQTVAGFNYFNYNRFLMEANIIQRNIAPNSRSFGKARLTKNFNSNIEII